MENASRNADAALARASASLDYPVSAAKTVWSTAATAIWCSGTAWAASWHGGLGRNHRALTVGRTRNQKSYSLAELNGAIAERRTKLRGGRVLHQHGRTQRRLFEEIDTANLNRFRASRGSTRYYADAGSQNPLAAPAER